MFLCNQLEPPPVAGMGGLPVSFTKRSTMDMAQAEHPPLGAHLRLLASGGGAPYFAVCCGEPFMQPAGPRHAAELYIKLRWLEPVDAPRFYARPVRQQQVLPELWRLTYADDQPLSCVSDWGELFAVTPEGFKLLSEKDIDELENQDEERNRVASQVRTF